MKKKTVVICFCMMFLLLTTLLSESVIADIQDSYTFSGSATYSVDTVYFMYLQGSEWTSFKVKGAKCTYAKSPSGNPTHAAGVNYFKARPITISGASLWRIKDVDIGKTTSFGINYSTASKVKARIFNADNIDNGITNNNMTAGGTVYGTYSNP